MRLRDILMPAAMIVCALWGIYFILAFLAEAAAR